MEDDRNTGEDVSLGFDHTGEEVLSLKPDGDSVLLSLNYNGEELLRVYYDEDDKLTVETAIEDKKELENMLKLWGMGL